MDRKEPIVFYDGDCGFCNSSVQFILSRRKTTFYFAPLQSEYADEQLASRNVTIRMDTLYLLKNNKVYERSGAALQICKGLKGLWPLMVIFYIIPRFMRDAVYDSVAKRRHRIQKGYCVKPLPEEAQFFL